MRPWLATGHRYRIIFPVAILALQPNLRLDCFFIYEISCGSELQLKDRAKIDKPRRIAAFPLLKT